jgi:hypothetical protein
MHHNLHCLQKCEWFKVGTFEFWCFGVFKFMIICSCWIVFQRKLPEKKYVSDKRVTLYVIYVFWMYWLEIKIVLIKIFVFTYYWKSNLVTRKHFFRWKFHLESNIIQFNEKLLQKNSDNSDITSEFCIFTKMYRYTF